MKAGESSDTSHHISALPASTVHLTAFPFIRTLVIVRTEVLLTFRIRYTLYHSLPVKLRTIAFFGRGRLTAQSRARVTAFLRPGAFDVSGAVVRTFQVLLAQLVLYGTIAGLGR